MRNTVCLAVSAALMFCSVSAMAQNRGTKEEQEACKPDVYRLCSEFIPSEDKIVACLKAKKKALSPACKKVID